MDQSKIAYTYTEAEDRRYGSDSHLFEPATDQAWGKTPLRMIQHISTQITKTHAAEEIALELLGADKKTMERCTALLQAGGVDTADMKVDTYGAHTYIKIPAIGQDDLIRVAAALSNTLDAPDRTTYYPLLPRDVLNEIADIAAAQMNISPLIQIKDIPMDADRAAALGMDTAPDRYTDIDMSAYYPASPVRFIRDDSQYAEADGKAVLKPLATLSVDPAKIPQLHATFKRAGITSRTDGEVISVQATSKDVLKALDQDGMIPHHFADTLEQL